jgi:hypothetical protein
MVRATVSIQQATQTEAPDPAHHQVRSQCRHGAADVAAASASVHSSIYKFESEWKVGTFRNMYRGRDDTYKGYATVCFGRNLSMYLDLNLEKYGVEMDWVVIKRL